MPNVYDKGDKVTLQATFKNRAGSLANPTTVTLKIKDPDGTVTTVTTPTITNPSVGVFEYPHSFTKAGAWEYRWISTGDPELEEPNSVIVRTPNVT